MKETENVSDEGTSRNREDMERHFSFIRVPFGSMTYEGYSCSRCGEEIRLNPRKFRA